MKKKADAAEKKAALERELAEFRQAEIQSITEFQKKTKSRRPDGLSGRELFNQAETTTAARTGVAPAAAAPANSQVGLVNHPGANGAAPPQWRPIPADHYDTPVKNLIAAHKAFSSVRVTGEGADAYKVR